MLPTRIEWRSHLACNVWRIFENEANQDQIFPRTLALFPKFLEAARQSTACCSSAPALLYVCLPPLPLDRRSGNQNDQADAASADAIFPLGNARLLRCPLFPSTFSERVCTCIEDFAVQLAVQPQGGVGVREQRSPSHTQAINATDLALNPAGISCWDLVAGCEVSEVSSSDRSDLQNKQGDHDNCDQVPSKATHWAS